jgi:ABC-type transporter Mla MlaB component
MKTRRKKPGARVTAAKKPAVTRKRAAVAPAKAARPAPSVAAPLGTDCTIEHAPALHKQLGKLLPNRACVTLDFSALKRCDTAGLQVLVAFIRERREAGRPLEMKGVQDTFLGTARLLGLSAVFGPVVEDGLAAQAGHA